MNKEIEDYKRLAERNLIDHSFEHAKETADRFAIRLGNPYVIVKNSGYQVWSKVWANKCDKEYVYDTSVSDSEVDIDVD
jgi:hypothetical protein